MCSYVCKRNFTTVNNTDILHEYSLLILNWPELQLKPIQHSLPGQESTLLIQEKHHPVGLEPTVGLPEKLIFPEVTQTMLYIKKKKVHEVGNVLISQEGNL